MKKIYLAILLVLLINFSLPNKLFAAEDSNDNLISGEIYEDSTDVFNDVEAPNIVLAEYSTGRILYQRNSSQKIYPASITKLMTAILVVENCELDEIVTVSENAVNSVPTGYVNANLQVGEELTIEDLMYAMLVPSANDAANALAEYVGGSIESFATMMNTRAKELGCKESNFTNPSGLHEDNHYTTAEDLFLIAKQAYSNSFIKKVIGTTKYSLPQTNKYIKETRVFATTNYMKKISLTKYYCDYCVGGKTGYTGEAKNCVVEFAEKNGIELVCVIMGENSSIKGRKFLDAKEMFDYVFENYEKKEVAKKDDKYETIKINNATKETKNLDVLYKSNVEILKCKDKNIICIEQEEKDNTSMQIIKTINYNNIKAPIKKGDIIGKITYEYRGTKYETELIASTDVNESKVLSKILYILLIILIIYIIYVLKKSNRNVGNHGKNYRKLKR